MMKKLIFGIFLVFLVLGISGCAEVQKSGIGEMPWDGKGGSGNPPGDEPPSDGGGGGVNVTYSGVLDMLNGCSMIEPQGYMEDISCDLICADEDEEDGLTCIKQYYGYYHGETGWTFDVGGDCDLSYGHINNTNEDGGSKLNCMCC
jgi:hypothetical protein